MLWVQFLNQPKLCLIFRSSFVTRLLPVIRARSQGPWSSFTLPDLQSTKWLRALAEWDAAKHPFLCIPLLCLAVADQWECGIRCYWFEHCPKQMGWRRKLSNWQQAQRTPAVSFHLNFFMPPLNFFFRKSDLIEATHPTFFLLKWKLQRIKKCADMQRQIQFQSMPRLFRLSSTHSWLPHCLFYPSLFHSFRSVTQNSLIWASGGVTHLDLMSAE